ncbi:MAG: divalent-cation tolerance protein CutA [Alphaproteobacteria bacterium]|nr:divalent-cation tolerance protein CutA [Alphaproteobacteria bacterium]
MERAVFVYTTWPSAVEAEKAGRALVERRLAACVNILPGMVSVYRWKGKTERCEEAVMIVKTRASLVGEVEAAVKELHSYSVPAILVWPLQRVEKSYLRWLMSETAGKAAAGARKSGARKPAQNASARRGRRRA